jgi:hypothetical protein
MGKDVGGADGGDFHVRDLAAGGHGRLDREPI